ncbi:MAG TPA: DoxX family protein [Actinomycetota bacterium]|jgi:putative oxidoreductase|nr:DoxX family protein [Actinomycetota bacterium]
MKDVVFPVLLQYADLGLLALRLMAGIVFFASGRNHLRDPVGRGKSIGASPGFTRVIGVAELGGAVGLALGILTQLAAIGLMLVMLGAMQKKIFVWKTGFWGKASYGWHYDLMLFVMCLVIALTGGGRFALV